MSLEISFLHPLPLCASLSDREAIKPADSLPSISSSPKYCRSRKLHWNWLPSQLVQMWTRGKTFFFFLLHWKIWVFMRHLTYRSWTISEWGTVFQSLGSFHRFSFYIFFSLHTLTCRFTVVSICFSSWCRCTVNVCMVSCCQLVRLFRGYSSIDIPGIAHFFQWTLLELQLMVRHDINCWNQCCQVHDDQD